MQRFVARSKYPLLHSNEDFDFSPTPHTIRGNAVSTSIPYVDVPALPDFSDNKPGVLEELHKINAFYRRHPWPQEFSTTTHRLHKAMRATYPGSQMRVFTSLSPRHPIGH
jgi:hypothetical protein